jgi:hypothetical protein
MGSAGASSKPIQDAKFDLQPKMEDDQSETKSNKISLENPGTIEELHKKCKG